MGQRLIIDGNAVYEIDEECIECKKASKENSKEKHNKKETKEKGKKQ